MGNRSPEGACATDFPAAGEVAEIIFTVYAASNVFSRGRRIRLDLSSPNFPRFDVNPPQANRSGRKDDRRRRTIPCSTRRNEGPPLCSGSSLHNAGRCVRRTRIPGVSSPGGVLPDGHPGQVSPSYQIGVPGQPCRDRRMP